MSDQQPARRAGVDTPAGELAAVIDIGSNSVRLVVFQGLIRVPLTLFNERVLCGLGRSVGDHGAMDAEAMDSALSTLKRFAFLCRDMKIDTVDVVATAAVRDASNGQEFVARIRQECGFEVRVLSGEEEATYSGLGVLAGIPGAEGVIADLGGGSLELARIEGRDVRDGLTLPIGPVRLLAGKSKLRVRHLDAVKAALGGVSWLEDCPGQSLYLVGGAWRSLARLHMARINAPLPLIQGYRLPGDELYDFADFVAGQSKQNLAGVAKISGKRLALLPLAAATLKILLERLRPDQVEVSAFGLREGLLFSRLDAEIQQQDPFIAVCKELADRTGRFPEHAQRLMAWSAPLFADETEEQTRARYAACLMSDISWRGHPDFRAENAFYEAFLGRFMGVSRSDRALIACALFLCYGGPRTADILRPALRLLSDDEAHYATALGLTLRLGQRLTGGTARPLGYSELELSASKLLLKLPRKYGDLAGAAVRSRLDTLAEILGVSGEIQVSGE